MSRTKASAAAGIVVLAVGLVALVGASRWESPLDRARADAKAWIKVHSSDLPTDLASINALPYEHRLAVVAALTPHQRYEYLAAHLDAFLRPAGELSAVQRDVLHGLVEPLTSAQLAIVRWSRDTLPLVLAPQTTKEQFAAFGQLVCMKAAHAFNVDVKRTVFGTIGTRDTLHIKMLNRSPSGSQARFASQMLFALSNLRARVGLATPECQCAEAWCDCPGSACDDSPCRAVNWWCGCLQATLCDRWCIW